ncbi:unnamed protein product, partial [Polarella glacialis]
PPPLCQRLLLGAEALTDSQVLGELLPREDQSSGDAEAVASGAPTGPWPGYGGAGVAAAAPQLLSMLLVVSLEDAQRCLAAGSASVRQEALAAMATLAPKHSRGACAAVCKLLEDE